MMAFFLTIITKNHNICFIIFVRKKLKMTNSEFMGLLIGCIATLLTIASVIVAIIIKPVINLNKSITRLNDNIDKLESDSKTLNERVTQHGKEIDENTKHLIIHDQEIEHLKEKVK